MSELNKYYKVTDGYCSCIVETLEEAEDQCEGLDGLSIEETFITEEEFNNLLEFEGF